MTENERVTQTAFFGSCTRRNDVWKKIWIYTLKWQFYFVVSGLKIIGHGSLDNNLESPCIMSETAQIIIHHYPLIRFCMIYVDDKVSLNNR
jgi:hypothetical protein